MLTLISKEEYQNIVRDLIEAKIESRFKPEVTKRKNHRDFFFLRMNAEDGSNSLQGIASAEIYETKRGNVASINTLWVSPEWRNNRYGEVLIFHLMKLAKEKYPIYSFMCSSNREALTSFLRNGFTSDSINSGKPTLRLFKAELE